MGVMWSYFVKLNIVHINFIIKCLWTTRNRCYIKCLLLFSGHGCQSCSWLLNTQWYFEDTVLKSRCDFTTVCSMILQHILYRPSKDNIDTYNEFTREIYPALKTNETSSNEVIIAGDFNIDLSKQKLMKNNNFVNILKHWQVITFTPKLHYIYSQP